MQLESDPAYAFDFFLAEKLRCTVEEMRRRVSAREWREWNVYYAKRQQQQELRAMRGR